MFNLPSGIDIQELINDLRSFSWEASNLLLYYSKILKDSDFKSNILKNDNIEDPVTLADLKVNDLIINRITEKYKDIKWEIVSEENVKKSSESFETNSDWVWVIDPLDGTRDFMQGTSNYAMHIALNYKCKPFLGIVLIPEKGELWIGYKDNIWCENKDGLKIKHNLSKNDNLRNMALITSKNHRNQTLENLIQKINPNKTIRMGSVGCKIASIIRGESDLYISLSLPGQSSPKDWDFAAPEALIKAAGGAITNLDNQELSYGKLNFEQGGIIIASNNAIIHKNICFSIREIIEKNQIYPI